jgi:hypothetical protein
MDKDKARILLEDTGENITISVHGEAPDLILLLAAAIRKNTTVKGLVMAAFLASSIADEEE